MKGVPVGISINGLNPADKALIAKIGFDKWLDKVAKEQEARFVQRKKALAKRAG